MRLIRAGFAYAEILEFSIEQIKLFVKLASRLEGERQATDLYMGAIAAQGSEKSIKETIKRLEGALKNGKQ